MNYPDKKDLLNKIDQKFESINQKPETHLEGLLWSKPITYWDYIHTDALLSLQTQRTTLPDEMVFIMYHQINELLFKMMLWEIDQIANQDLSPDNFLEKINRLSRYFDMLTNSFCIMSDGMEVEQYLKFRTTLTPASGFQSAQYRMIEFATTDLKNLIDNRYRKNFDKNASFSESFENLYWQAAGKDHEANTKSKTLTDFETKYKDAFLRQMEKFEKINIWQKFKNLPVIDQKKPNLVQAMRHLDYTINITWVMQHYNTASKYIGGKGQENIEATGGSHWRKYMHPKYQKRIFFPDLWTKMEIENWGENL